MRAAAPLLDAIRARRGGPLRIDGSQVEKFGAQCLQVLLAAESAWAKDGYAFEIFDPSTALEDGWALMGAKPLPACAAAPLETAP